MASLPPNTPPDEIPLAPPPPGTESNFDDPESRGYQLWVVSLICLALVVPSLTVRLYMRLRITKNSGWDDLMAVLATVCLIPVVGINLYMTTYYTGRHVWDVRAVDAGSKNATLVVAWYTIYLFGSMFARLSILLVYLRIFDMIRIVRILIFTGIAFVVCYNLTAIIAHSIYFKPAAKVEDIEETAKFIHNILMVSIAHAIVNVFADIYIMVLPIQPLCSLSLSRKSKIRVSLVFITGSFAVISAIIGLAFRLTFVDVPDISYYVVDNFLCIISELSVGIICSCMPLFPRFYREVIRKGDTKTENSRGTTSYNSNFTGAQSFTRRMDLEFGQHGVDTTASPEVPRQDDQSSDTMHKVESASDK